MPNYRSIEGMEQIVLNLSEGFSQVLGLDQTTADTLYRRLDTSVPSADVVGLDTHTGTANIHTVLDDANTSSAAVWSAAQIISEIGVHSGTASIHRSINDSGSSTTDLWSASKINSDITAHTGNAALHRIINDSGTSATELWSASKISSEISGLGSGSGDFLADGSVAMTGDFDLAGNDIISDDVDLTGTIGRMMIGYLGFPDNAALAHRDNATTTGYILRQSSSGNTLINSATGRTTSFMIANVVQTSLASGIWDFKSVDVISADSDTNYLLGRASIGYDGSNSDSAMFAHRDHADSTSYALSQDSAGATYLNANAGQAIRMRIGGSTQAFISSAGNFGIGTLSPDKLLHVIDSPLSSPAYGGDIQAVFENDGNSGVAIQSSATGIGSLMFGDIASGEAGRISYDHSTDTFNWKVAGVTRLGLNNGNFYPQNNNYTNLGVSGFAWKEIFAVNGTINTSDERLKKDITPSPLGLEFINGLKPVSYGWKENDEGLTHYGFLSQDVGRLLGLMGVAEDKFAGYSHDEETDSYGLRYTEFIAPLTKAVQQISARLDALEGKWN